MYATGIYQGNEQIRAVSQVPKPHAHARGSAESARFGSRDR